MPIPYMQSAVNGHQPVGTPQHGPPHIQSHFTSPGPGVSYYMMSPGQYQSPMHVQPMHTIAPSPVVDCWGFPGWFPFASTAHMQPAVVRPAPPHPALVAFDDLMKTELEQLLKCCDSIGHPVSGYGQAIAAAFKAQRDMIGKALKMKRPPAADITKLLAPTEAALTMLEALKTDLVACEEHAALKNHLQMLCGGCSALGWVTTADPKAYVSDALNAVPVFGRKIQEAAASQARAAEANEEGGEGSVADQVAVGEVLTKRLKDLLRGLREYVQHHHAAGLTWAPDHPKAAAARGVDASESAESAGRHASLSTDTEKQGYAGAAIVSEFDQLLRDRVVPLVETCYELGDDMICAADCMQRAFKAQRDMLVTAARHAQPPQEVLDRLLENTSQVLSELAELEDECEGKAEEYHVKLVVNGMSALAWVSVEHPVAYLSDIVNSLPVFSEKIQLQAKRLSGAAEGSRCAHTELVTRFKELLRGILAYVKARHPHGVSWNPNAPPLTLHHFQP